MILKTHGRYLLTLLNDKVVNISILETIKCFAKVKYRHINT
jgi:hypothetical protein